VDDRAARRNVWVLVAAQAVLGSQVTMVFVVGGLAGNMLAPIHCLATLPISMIVFGAMITAPWLSGFMQRHGRRSGFLVGAAGGLLGTGIAAWGLSVGSFALFLVGSFLTGVYMAAQGFYRFAATDTASESFKPKAISWVLAGGLISAFTGPWLATYTEFAFPIRYLGSYVAATAITLIGMPIFFLLSLPSPPKGATETADGPSWLELLARPRIRVAVVCAMVSYALMNLVMTSAPLAITGCGFATADAANGLTLHVLAMFVPSFFTGHLIARFGAERIITAGLLILATAGLVGLSGVELTHFFGTLILLGLGWNFGFIGATAMLTSAYRPEERGRAQGMNDSIVMGCVTVASLSSGGLMNCMAGTAAEGWQLVNIAMAPFLALAGAALIWLVLRPKTA
jgi:MFS family permease